MASNFTDFNGDHSEDQHVRAKSFTTSGKVNPPRDRIPISQKYPPGGISQRIVNQFPERGNHLPPDIRNEPYSDMRNMMPMNRQDILSSGGSQSQYGRRNPVNEMSDQYQPNPRKQFPHMGPPMMENRPPNYSTAEQVQHLASQMHEILQEIREIKGFAGLINNINSKVDHIMTQNNQLSSVVDDIQFDVGNIKSQMFMQETIRYEREEPESEVVINQPSEGFGRPGLINNTPDQSTRFSQDMDIITDREDSGYRKLGGQVDSFREEKNGGFVLSENGSKRFESSVDKREKIPVELANERHSPTRQDNELSTDHNGQHQSRLENEKRAMSPTILQRQPKSASENRRALSPTGHITINKLPNRERHEVSKARKVDNETTMSLTGPMRSYKCKKTNNSDDNRLSYFCPQDEDEDEDSESDIEQPKTGVVRPQPRPLSPENATMPKRIDVGISRTEADSSTLEDGYIKPKEDQYLEQLALSENFRARDCLDPKSSGADTVICIDTSESMTGEPFKKCVEFVNQFVDYIEEWASEFSIEENIAIVHFGKEAKILQQLTNDYNKVRDAVENLKTGGPTPMMTGLVVAMSALFNRGGPVTVHNRQINPRVILLSDGNATDHRIFEGPDILQPNGFSEQMIKDKLEDFAERVKLENRHIISVPVSNRVNLETLRILAETTGGHVTSTEDIKKLSRAFFVEVLISQTRYEGIPEDIKTNRQEIAALARSQQNGKELTDNEMNEVVTRVIQETEEEIEINRLREQQRNEIDEESEMEVGLRVRRGPDWTWGDQDGFGTGTVIGHRSRGYVRVKWDCGNVGRYRHGAQNAHDLAVVDEPRILPDDVLIAEGVYVRKGRDWEWDDQDGGDGSVGCVYHFEDEGIVHVRWENGIRGNYRFGAYGKMDLEIITPQEYERMKQKRKHQTSSGQLHEETTGSNIPNFGATGFQNYSSGGTRSNIQTDGPNEEPPTEETDNIGFKRHIPNISQVKDDPSNMTTKENKPSESSDVTDSNPAVWQYELDGEWHDYSEKDCKRIETFFSTKRNGTLIISVNGENCRVTPHKMKQKNTKTEVESKIRRLEQMMN